MSPPFSNPVDPLDLYFQRPLKPVAPFVIRARRTICAASSIVLFSNRRLRPENDGVGTCDQRLYNVPLTVVQTEGCSANKTK